MFDSRHHTGPRDDSCGNTVSEKCPMSLGDEGQRNYIAKKFTG